MIAPFEKSAVDRRCSIASTDWAGRRPFMVRRKQLVMKALEAALKVRRDMHVGLWTPVCVYDLADKMGVDVRFLPYSSMEGIYSKSDCPVIVVSALRPTGRQAYTCAHELGHHIFGHESSVSNARNRGDPQEILADMFAGFLLMPKSAVEHAFTIRGWDPHSCTPLQLYTIAGWLSVGYQTLIYHMTNTLHLLPAYRARNLEKIPLGTIRAEYLKRETKENLIIVDTDWSERAIDVQVGDLIQLPANVHQEGDLVYFQEDNQHGRLFCAIRQGQQGRFFHPATGWAASVRVSRKNFVGRALYRHLEDPDDD
jgi:Zn-dependent peptidase ImmA (M78 family)